MTLRTSSWMELKGNLYRFERVKDQHARGARGAGARHSRPECVRSEVTALHVNAGSLFPSAVLMTLRIAEGRYGTREVILQDLASNALKGNVLS